MDSSRDAQLKESSKKFPERFFLAVMLVLVFAMAARTPLDSDMWWHLRAGQETWTSGRPLTVDTFSHTRYGAAWVNHSWLAQVGMYLVFEAWGYLGLAAAVALLAALSMGWVYAQMEGHPLLRGFVLILATAVAATVWSPRPQLLSLVLFGAVGYLLYLYKWRQVDRLWILPMVFVLWSNLHGGYVLGLLLILAMIAGEILNHLLGIEGEEVLPWRGIGRLALWGALSGLVVVINPNGLAMWAIPFRTVGVGVLQEYVSEWASPDFHQFFQQPFLWLLLGTLGAAGLSRRRLDGSDLVAVLGFAYLALVARRNFGPFAMAAAPVLSRHLWALAQEWTARAGPRWAELRASLPEWLRQSGELPPGIARMMNVIILGLLALAAVVKLLAVTSPELVGAYEAQTFPKAAAAWTQENQPPGNLFNEYNWGGYLLWALPEHRVFVDGRTDLYDDAVLREYLDIASGADGCLSKLDARGVNLALVDAGSGLARVLASSPGWEQGFADAQAVVFVRLTPD